MTPVSTYRLQLHGEFTFDDAASVASYIRDLGVSHVYCSPYLQATKGSTHGYDVVDHNRLNEELGGEDGHGAMVGELRRLGLGQIVDIVPNHMAIGERGNLWWWDVLENGPSSRFADYFDVDWDPPEARMHNLVLVPILADHYGRVLEKGELRIALEKGKFVLHYGDSVLPVSPESMADAVARAASLCDSDELAFLADYLRALPAPTPKDPLTAARRHRDKEVVARHLDDLASGEPAVTQAIRRVVDELNRDPDALDGVLSQQNYRLAFWRTAGRELGYRRFFDINTLAGLRTENPAVFRDTHQLVFEWLRSGILDGVRIDHPDGLRDPREYFARLHSLFPNSWIVVEKILEPGERLRESWEVAGSTGYEFLHRVDSLFVDPEGEEPLTRIYSEFAGCGSDYVEIVRERKHQVMRGTLGSDVNRLTAQFMAICERHRRFRDFTRHEIHHSLREVIACFPVYRTYVRAHTGEVEDDDRRYVSAAVESAKTHRPDLPADLFDFVRAVLLLEVPGDLEGEFVMRFQQFTGPVMAKGVEDTTFYVFNRLGSLNEVGGDPGRFGMSPDDFHQLTAASHEKWPEAMLYTSTHDTKRGEDVRCRIHLLSEIPEDWEQCVRRWSTHNEKHRTGELPDRNMEYLLYQTLVGAWPIETDRVLAYMEKASREAKTQTSWTDPDPAYDKALADFVLAVCADAEFCQDLDSFAERLRWPGRVNSLSQTLIRMTAPGVPDTYQGTEIWLNSLVDPDNRRPVDYELRRRLLAELAKLSPEQMLDRCEEGFPKLHVIRQALRLRQEKPASFGPEGAYTPIQVEGTKSNHLVGFIRGGEVITLVPRLVIGLRNNWNETYISIPDGNWRNVLAGDTVASGRIELGQIFRRFPVALLRRD